MSGLDSLLPGLDLGAGTITFPLWVVVGTGLVLVLLGISALLRPSMGVLLCLAVGVVGVGLAWSLFDRAAERRALDRRVAELAALAMAPGSALGCLGANVGEAIEAPCEKAVFASPESVASAVAYAGAQLALLSDGVDFAARDASYQSRIEDLRRAVEADRYGLVAQVLATREHCGVNDCGSFALLRDPNRVQANLKDHVFEALVVRNSSTWVQKAQTHPEPVASNHSSAPGIGVSGINFPSSASIPPVSIMNNEPGAGRVASPSPSPAAPTPAQRRPATTASAPSRPVQLQANPRTPQ